jgi:hypothetical protein
MEKGENIGVTKSGNIGAFLLIGILLFSGFSMSGAQYTVDGTVTRKVWSNKHGRLFIHDHRFKVSVNGCKWFISTHTNNPPSGAQFYEFQSAFDGQNMYSLPVRHKANGITGRISEKLRSMGRQNEGQISRAVSPLAIFSAPEVVWAAFASQCYFDSLTTNRIKPFWNDITPPIVLHDYDVPANWIRAKNEPRLPSLIEFIMHEEAAGVVKNGRLLVTKRRSGFKPYTNCVYRVLDSTNLSNGLEIPLKFTWTRLKRNGDEMSLITGLVDAIETSAGRTSFKPALQKKVWVQDLRFATSNNPPGMSSVTYPTTKWLEATNDFVQASLELEKYMTKRKKLNLAAEEPGMKLIGRWVFLGILGLTSIGFIWLIRRQH